MADVKIREFISPFLGAATNDELHEALSAILVQIRDRMCECGDEGCDEKAEKVEKKPRKPRKAKNDAAATDAPAVPSEAAKALVGKVVKFKVGKGEKEGKVVAATGDKLAIKVEGEDEHVVRDLAKITSV